MIKTIQETQVAKQSDYDNQLKQVVKYLIQNRLAVKDPLFLQPIFNVKPFTKTIINELFDQTVNSGYINEFASLYIDKTVDNNVPDLLTLSSIAIDLKNNPVTSPLAPFKELKDKILVNISTLIRTNTATRSVQVSDINELHSMYVKGLLTRSFAMSDGWLTSSLCTYLIKSFCLPISSIIARNEYLTYPEQLQVAMVFAFYMSQLLGRKTDSLVKPPLFFRNTYLGNMQDLNNFAARIESYSTDGLDIPKCCAIVAELGPQRLQKFNADLFYRSCTSLGPSQDTITTHIAFENPAYWLYLVLQVLSGNKVGSLVNQFKLHKLIGTESAKFATELKVCRQLFENR